MADRVSSQALRGRVGGVMVGALIALAWAVFALSIAPAPLRYALVAVAVGLTGLLLVASGVIQRRARDLITPDRVSAPPVRRMWLWFLLNFAGEVVLLNIAVNLLDAPSLRDYWIPAISAVVGLHFWPMAYLFRSRSYWWIGAGMMAVAAITALLVRPNTPSAVLLAHGEALVNALILWAAVGTSVPGMRR